MLIGRFQRSSCRISPQGRLQIFSDTRWHPLCLALIGKVCLSDEKAVKIWLLTWRSDLKCRILCMCSHDRQSKLKKEFFIQLVQVLTIRELTIVIQTPLGAKPDLSHCEVSRLVGMFFQVEQRVFGVGRELSLNCRLIFSSLGEFLQRYQREEHDVFCNSLRDILQQIRERGVC